MKVCKFKFVRCGPVKKNQSALSFSVESWRPDEVRERHFPNSKIEIFDYFHRFSTKFPIFKKNGPTGAVARASPSYDVAQQF